MHEFESDYEKEMDAQIDQCIESVNFFARELEEIQKLKPKNATERKAILARLAQIVKRCDFEKKQLEKLF